MRSGWRVLMAKPLALSPLSHRSMYFYVARKQIGIIAARQMISDMINILSICRLDQTIVQAAHALPMADFEDAVQAAAAAAAGLDALVTRNTRDYAGALLPILTPAEALARMSTP